MPTSLPPLPDEIDDSQEPPEAGLDDPSGMPPAFGGGMPPEMEAARMIEQGYKMLAMSRPSLVPMCAQAISQLRVSLNSPPTGADAGEVSAGPTGPAITGAVQNPTMLPPPPQGL